MVYFKALIGTSFLMLMASIFAEGVVWQTMEAFHASKSIILSGEIITLLPLAVMFIFVYKVVLDVERDMNTDNYHDNA